MRKIFFFLSSFGIVITLTGCTSICRAGVTCIHALATQQIERCDKLSEKGKADFKLEADKIRDDVFAKLDKLDKAEEPATETTTETTTETKTETTTETASESK